MAIKQVKLGELVEDLTVYPRGSVSEVRVADLCYALDAGARLPPPVIDKTTRKIVDGFHRVRALRRRLGDSGVTGADVREFAGAAEMLLESSRLNSLHGLPLGRYDQRVVHVKASALGASDDQIASALGVTATRLLQIVIRQADSAGGPVPLKRGSEFLSGAYLTAEQVAAIRRMRGAPARAKVAELTRLLEAGLVPLQHDPDLRLALAKLISAGEEALASFAAAG